MRARRHGHRCGFRQRVMLSCGLATTPEEAMDRKEFEAELQAEGYRETTMRDMPANHENPEHAHPFDARLLILDGEMTIACAGG